MPTQQIVCLSRELPTEKRQKAALIAADINPKNNALALRRSRLIDVALQPTHGPGKPDLYSACHFQYMGPACDGIPTTTTAPPPPPPTTAPRRVPATTAPYVTEPANDCDPNYAGVCVPAGVEDVDCAGGSGNGPYYVRGPVQVVGRDIYGLDGNDNDGIGCE